MHSIAILFAIALMSISYSEATEQLVHGEIQQNIFEASSNEDKPFAEKEYETNEKTKVEMGKANDQNPLVIDCNCGETGDHAVIRAKRQCGYGYGYGCCCGPTGPPVTGMPCGCCGGCWGR